MKLYKDLGFYIPASFVLQVNVEESIDAIINSKDERTLSHELIHFLQDVSTTYGLINICSFVDVLKNQNKIALSSNNELITPIPISSYSYSVSTNLDLFSCYSGDSADKFTEFPDSIVVTTINEELMEIEGLSYGINVIEIEYGSDVLSNSKKFHFGSMAIYESMANLVENEIYSENEKNKNFPYDSASMIVDYLCPSLTANNAAISEICEASLMFYNPADIFIKSLRKINEDRISFVETDGFYNYILSNYTLEDKKVIDEFNNVKAIAINQLNDLFTVEPLKSEHWASNLVSKGGYVRNKGTSLSSLIFSRDQIEKRAVLMETVKSIGFPVAFNSNDEIWIQDTESLLNTPLMFPVILSINEIFMGKRCQCYLYNFCDKHGGYIVNNNCIDSPWERAKNGTVCYFANIWKMWGLENIGVIQK